MLRTVFPKAPRVVNHRFFIEYDPLLGWKKIPNLHGVQESDEYKIYESINSKGIRGPEYDYTKKAGEYRVLILGDSSAEGYTVNFGELFSEVMKKKLNHESGRYYEVINAGTRGYSTDQELLFFQQEGKKYNPDLTILTFNLNDVWYNNQLQYWIASKPLFKLENNELHLTDAPTPKPKPIAHGTRSIKEWFSENSYLYNLVQDRIKNSFLYGVAIKLGFVPYPDEFRVLKTDYDQDIREAWWMTEALLVQLKDETQSIGSQLLIFTIPFRASYYEEEWRAMKRRYGLSDDGWDVERDKVELETICKRNKIDCIDPTAHFVEEARRLKSSGKRLNFLKDGHWTVEGHKLAGEILAEYIRQNYLMTKSLQSKQVSSP